MKFVDKLRRSMRIPDINPALFSEIPTGKYFEDLQNKVHPWVNKIDEHSILADDREEFVQDFMDTHVPEIPRLGEAYSYGEPQEVIAQKAIEGVVEIHRNTLKFVYCIPFSGDPVAFVLTPKSAPCITPRATLQSAERELVFVVYVLLADSEEKAHSELAGFLNSVNMFLGSLAAEFDVLRRHLISVGGRALLDRRSQIERKRRIIKAMKVPIRRREKIPTSIPVPLKKTTPRALRPIASPTTPQEFTIEESTYQGILGLIQNMAVTMERNPTFFAKATETNIRDILLVTLNSIYQGAATGETFSVQGKTDIQIIHQGKSVFIAELKFCQGPKSLTRATDQLFRYLSWRDTRVAIVLLNKKGKFTKVLEQIASTLTDHTCFKSLVNREASSFRFVLTHPKDADRDVILTLLAFDLDPILKTV